MPITPIDVVLNSYTLMASSSSTDIWASGTNQKEVPVIKVIMSIGAFMLVCLAGVVLVCIARITAPRIPSHP